MAELEFKHQESLTSGTNENPISLTVSMTNVQSTKFTVKTLKRQVNAVLSIFCRSGLRRSELSVHSHTTGLVGFFF